MFKFICASRLYHKIPTQVKYLAQAGGKLEKKYIDELIIFQKKNDKKFYLMYGQTEASPRISSFNVMKNLKKKLSIGKPFKQTYIKLIDTNKTKGFKDKEIFFFGKNVCLGYSKNLKDLKKGDINFGKLRTGDVGLKIKMVFIILLVELKDLQKFTA